MTLMNRALLLLLLVFSFSCKDDLEPLCSFDQEVGEVEPFPYSLDFLPYDYNNHERLVFKNEEGDEMTFIPASEEVFVSIGQSGSVYICDDGMNHWFSYKPVKYIYKYISTSGVRLYMEISPQKKQFPGNPPEYRFFDLLEIWIYKGEMVDGHLTLDIDHKMKIPLSFRNQEKFEISGSFIYDDLQPSYTLGQRSFQDAYLSKKHNPEIVFNQQQGLISFLDEEGVQWVIERFETLDSEVAHNFSLPDTSNMVRQLNNVEGKLVLLDFWASWCEPCREDIAQYLKPLYNEYHEKGLEIVSISLDTDRESWISAIEEDGMPWMQLSDLEGYQSMLFVHYEIYGIPTVYVLDENKNILSKNLRGESLATFVQEYLNQGITKAPHLMHQPEKQLILGFLFCLIVVTGDAQENASRSFFSYLYGDAQLGLLFTGEYNTGQFNANVGFRFDKHHSLGVGFYGFTEGAISTTRSARGFGLQYGYQLKRFLLDATIGRVSQYRFTTDYHITPVIDEKQPSPWFYRFGLHYRTFMGLTYGVSFAWAKEFALTYTDTEVNPAEVRHSQIRGGQVFTIDVGFLIQKNE